MFLVLSVVVLGYGWKRLDFDSTNDGDLRKLVKLKQALASIVDEEAIVPPVVCPTLIRSEYDVGPNPTAFRLSLDAERNQITRDRHAVC